MSKVARQCRRDYVHFSAITTRWMDNDIYAHVNNVVYYSWFDTAVNGYLVERGVLDLGGTPLIGLVVSSSCDYFAPIAFPDVVHAGLRVARIGRSSVRYEIGLFRNSEDHASAQGHFVHVYVDRATRRPCQLTEPLGEALACLAVERPADHQGPL